MNKKQVIGRNFIVFFFTFLVFFFTSMTFFIVTKQGENRETNLIADSIVTRLDEDEQNTATINAAYLKNPLIHVSIFNYGNPYPIADTMNYYEKDTRGLQTLGPSALLFLPP